MTRTGVPTAREMRGIVWRSHYLQAAWNTRSMQGVGFCYALMPLLRRYAGDSERRTEFLKRHVGFFNTNPVFAGYVLGAVAAMEVSGADGAEIERVKKGMSSPLGMSGDALIWGALRPFAGVLAVLLALAGAVWAPVVMLVAYGLPAVAMRARGVAVGLRSGPNGAKEVLGVRVKGAVRILRGAAAFGVGLVLAVGVRSGGNLEVWKVLAAAAFLVLAWAGTRARVPATVMGAAGAAIGLILLAAGLNGGSM